MILLSKTRNLRDPDHLQNVLLANEQTILLKNVGMVPMQQTDPNGSNKNIQQTVEMMDNSKET